MRVLHVATLLSADGAFGGPLRVAANLCDGLAERGHEVVLGTGWDGVASAVGVVEHARVRTFRSRQLVPGTGFSGLAAPGLWRWLRREVEGADLVHVHLGRDLTTAVAALVCEQAGRPLVVQTHGMVLADGRARSRVFDAVLMRRVLRRTAAALPLTDVEADSLRALGAPMVEQMPNGIALPDVVEGAAAPAGPPDVLFCARLQVRKRPLAFVRMAGVLVAAGVEAHFSLVGPDEGEAAAVVAEIARLGLGDHVSWEGPLAYGSVLDRMRRAAVYVLPSVDEPFGMSLLEAMSLGIPSVTTDSIAIASLLAADDACAITDGTPEGLAAAVRPLLDDPARASALGARGRASAARRFAADAVVDRVERIYEQAVAARF